jgi:hypothetical protein
MTMTTEGLRTNDEHAEDLANFIAWLQVDMPGFLSAPPAPGHARAALDDIRLRFEDQLLVSELLAKGEGVLYPPSDDRGASAPAGIFLSHDE